MNVVDSSGWLEYFANSSNAAFFAQAIEDTSQLIVPSITIYEVYKWLLLYGGAPKTTWNISLLLPVADSMILTTAFFYNATLWTQDAHFAGINGVQYIPKPSS